MEQEAIAVKHNSVDASLKGFLGNGLAHLSGDFALVALGDSLRGSGAQGITSDVVDDLGINLLIAAEDTQPGTLGGATDAATDAPLDFISSI